MLTRDHWSASSGTDTSSSRTGRSVFPGFVARSEANPGSVLPSAAARTDLRMTARDEIADGIRPIHIGRRWDAFGDHPVCA